MNTLRYWRTSLADGCLAQGKFRHKDRSRFIQINVASLKNGRLSEDETQIVFKQIEHTTKIARIRIWPLVAARKTSHGASLAGGMPDIVAPLITDATVDREGTIYPNRSTIARDLLTPLADEEFSLGGVADLDMFLTEFNMPPRKDGADWPEYLAYCRKMVDTVIAGWPNGETDYLPIGAAFLELSSEATATVRPILDLYDTLLSDKPDIPLLARLACPQGPQDLTDGSIDASFKRRLGHSNPRFQLAVHQRQVLAVLDGTTQGQVIAVNGPPGTGKTTLILSAVASQWVRAALNETDPPIIVAASSNNQAVTNIIDAFGKDFASGDGPFAGRWIPEVTSFGMFLPSHSRKSEAAERYQTEAFQTKMESKEAYVRSKLAFLNAAKLALPNLPNFEIKTIVTALHALIKQEANKLSTFDRCQQALDDTLDHMQRHLGGNPEFHLTLLKQKVDAKRLETEIKTKALTAFEGFLATESIFSRMLKFLPAVAEKRLLGAHSAIGDDTYAPLNVSSVDALGVKLRSDRHVAEQTMQLVQTELVRAERIEIDFAIAQRNWDDAVAAISGAEDSFQTLEQLDQTADLRIRFQLFLLATHYWEGRWLLAMEGDLDTIVRSSSKEKPGIKTAVPRWQRRMMLTPCAVATFASLPSKMVVTKKTAEKYSTHYLLNFIDLLIVDEAGQILPETAGASFSLAKKALVIGDTQQIEPISTIPMPVDFGNLRACNLTTDLNDETELKAVIERGISSTQSSAMHLAQQACQISPYSELEKGLYLFEHRRCYDEIINFCNVLCYNGALRPMRGSAPKNAVLPAIGYLHIDGRALISGNSRANPVEAKTIAAWLADNRQQLEKAYGKKLEEIVAVITPFGQQVRELKAACQAAKIATKGSDNMTIGTVHSLQGAERPIVIFSPVYTKHADGSFIDGSASMLNVTVSRAKDSFLVFGDIDVFSSATPGTPRALLSQFLHRESDSGLEYSAAPRDDLSQNGRIRTLRDANEHDEFLLSALASSATNFTIVSPWIITSTMRRTGILDALKKAVERGAQINVFVDPLLNAEPTKEGRSNFELAHAELTLIGVTLHSLPQLHSKIVAIDNNQLCIGSYNWLSADRHGKYARHETSFIYQGEQVEQEIGTIVAALIGREKHM